MTQRTIKFRAKRMDTGEWVKGGLWYFDGRPERIDEAKIFLLLPDEHGVYRVKGVDVDPSTVGQFTGLLDKRGKEIWEGDRDQYGRVVKWYRGHFTLEKEGTESWCWLSDAQDIVITRSFKEQKNEGENS